MLALDEIQRTAQEFFVDGLHSLFGQRPSVLDLLGAVRLCPAMQDAARSEFFLEFRVLRVVGVFWLLLGVQMVEVAEELIEAVDGRQELVAVAEMVLAELAGGVTEWLRSEEHT